MNKRNIITILSAISVLFSAFIGPCLSQDEEVIQQDDSSGYQTDFEYLRDHIGFQAYSGSLKGSMGTQVEEAGNSLDRAFLLHRLLSAKGFRPQIALGRLRGANLDKVIALSQGITLDDQTSTLNPTYREKLGEVLQEHYWVQLPLSGGRWLDLDPTLPEAVPGKTIAGLRKQIKRVPTHLFQRLEIKVFCEFSIGRDRATSQMLRYVGLTKDLVAEPVVIFFLDRGVHGDYRYSPVSRFNPVLWANGKVQSAVNLRSEANRQATLRGGKVPPLEVHRIWMEYTLKAPGSRDYFAERLLFSENSPENSRLDELTLISLFTQPRRDQNKIDTVKILRSNSLVLQGFKEPEFPEVLSELEKMSLAKTFFSQKDFAQALLQEVSGHLAAASESLEKMFTVLPGQISPKLVSVSLDPGKGRISTDLLVLNFSPISSDGGDLAVIATSFSAGVLASYQEGEILREIRNLSSSTGYSDALSQTEKIFEAGGKWIAVDINSFYKLSPYGLDRYLLRRLEGALKGDKYLIVPDLESYLVSGGKIWVWWEVDRFSGSAVGMISSGIGGSCLQDENSLEKLATHYQPAVTRGWTARLAEYSDLLATSMENASGNERNILSEKRAIILKVYQIIASALITEKPKGMPPSLELFFGPEGKAVMGSYLAAPQAETEREQLPLEK